MKPAAFHYGEDQLTVGIALEISRGQRTATLSAETIQKIIKSRNIVERVVEEERVVYGVTTGFGPLCTTFISPENTRKLQYNLLISHSVGVGQLIPKELSKLMLILKVHALAQGYSGITSATLERIIWHIEQDAIPCVPEQGSVGASGDLAPLSHLFLPLLGLGKVHYQGKIIPTAELFKKTGLEAIELEAKEGLALINGTQFMAAFGIAIVERLQNCLDQADIIAAMNIEALAGSAKPFTKGLHDVRPHAGCQYVAQRLHTLLNDSEIMQSHIDCDRVQDPYSLRCIPQVHGASRNAWLHLKDTLHTEINSVTDNPILLDAENIISGGNFHGQPIALPLDYAGMAAAEIGNISDRRVYLTLEGKYEGLPKLLLEETGLNSGFMIPQYTTAALVSENKSLCFPASVDSIPTSMGQEDHVSMGSISGRKTLRIVENLEKILGIELLYAAQGIDFRRPLKSSIFIEACHDHVRQEIGYRKEDRPFEEDLEKVINMIREGDLIRVTDEVAQNNKASFSNRKNQLFGIY